MARPEETVSPPRGGPSAAGAGDAAWGPMESDPRRPGLHYMVLIATRTEGARRLAAFCRARGLETYVVGGNNERLRCVVVLPGVTIGRGAVIGAGAVVTKDVPELALALGIPAKVVGHRGPRLRRV